MTKVKDVNPSVDKDVGQLSGAAFGRVNWYNHYYN